VDLKALKEAANDAINRAYSVENVADYCVNWGDLDCVRAERAEDDEGEVTYRVFIEEADPSNASFHEFVSAHLTKAGFDGVEVVTEW
jgi:hypothetical protein